MSLPLTRLPEKFLILAEMMNISGEGGIALLQAADNKDGFSHHGR